MSTFWLYLAQFTLHINKRFSRWAITRWAYNQPPRMQYLALLVINFNSEWSEPRPPTPLEGLMQNPAFAAVYEKEWRRLHSDEM